MDDGVTVTGVGRVAVTPDRLRASLRLECAGANVAEALAALTRRTDALLAVAAERGVSHQDVVTAGLHVEPRWTGKHEARRDGYQATHRITVTLAESSAFGELLAALVDVVGDDLGIDTVERSIGDRPEERRQARAGAVADARDQAEQLAGLAGRRLGTVTWVREHPAERLYDDLRGDEAVAMSRSVRVQPGTVTLASAVTVCWAWE